MIKRILAILLLGVSSVFAQTVQTTPNLITSGTTHTWSGVTTGTIGANYMPSGSTSAPRYEPSTNSISFSYAQATVAQTIAINNALANVGAGIKVNGYNYSYETRNMNGDDRQGSVDTYTVMTKMTSSTGSTLLSTSQTFNTKFDWTTYSGTQTATTPYDLNSVGNLQFSATGKDSGFWAGYFGPQIRNVNMSLNYGVDPCAANPAYSPTCANYNTVQFSSNVVPNPTGYATSGSSIDQSYAINQALGQAGAGATIHGFQWGYQANANGPYCAFWLLVCLDDRIPSVTTNVNITSSTGASLYSIQRTYTNSYNTTSYQYLFPTSKPINTLGNFNFTATTNDQAYIGDMWSKYVYTPDPCSVDPLSSTTCPGYAAAYLAQQCTVSALYNTSCPGYTVAYFNQQCTINPLYDQACPGYAAAYLTQQCSINPLYSTTCSGYETAYFNQQCSLNPLYSTRCTGYSQAYHDQQCSLNPLYATDCTGYAQAYHDQQCSANPLYMSDCPGYAQAYFNQQCTADPLYNTQCNGYKAAYALKYITPTTTTTAPTTTTTPATTVAAAETVEAVKVASDPVAAVTTSSTSTTSATSVSPVAVISTVKPAATTTTTETVAQAEPKKEEKKAEDKPQSGTQGTEQKADGPKPKTAREELQAKREEAAKKEAVAKGKDLANQMGQAADLEAQKAVQNVVIQAMGFTPGFDQYGKGVVPDAQFYRPFEVYGGQKNIDNRTGLRMFGGSDRVHEELINSQYLLGK